MALTIVGFNHRTAPIEIRERLAWSYEALPGLLTELVECGASGAVVLTTCNRTEFYLADPRSPAIAEVWRQTKIRIGSAPGKYAYVHQERGAVRHLFRVAAGLDSMLLGESEIQGQVRNAWEAARSVAGPILSRLFQWALLVGGRVRAETAIAAGAASIPGAALSVARKIFGDLSTRRVVVLGAGEMAELAVASLASEGVRAVIVAHSRTEHAAKIAGQYGGRAVAFDDGWNFLPDADIVVCSTSSPGFLITPEVLSVGVRKPRSSPVCILDISLPRNVDPEVARLPNIFLYDIDDLKAAISAATGKRRREIPGAESIVDQEVGNFWQWYRGRGAVRAIRALRERMDQVRQGELDRALKRLRHLEPKDQERVARLTQSLMNKFLHEPTITLRAAAEEDEHARLAEALYRLFHLEDES